MNPLTNPQGEEENGNFEGGGQDGEPSQNNEGGQDVNGDGIDDISGEMPDVSPEDMQKVMVITLWKRINELAPPEAQAFTAAITPETAPVMVKLFPELTPLIDEIIQAKGGGMQQGGAPQMAGPPQGQPQPQMAAPQGAAPQQMPTDPRVSQGLIG